MTLQANSSKNVDIASTHQADRFLFWQRWLIVYAEIVVVSGLAIAFLNGTPLFNFLNDQVNPVFWGTAAIPASTIAFQQWVYGVTGAVMAGWGVFMAFIAYYPFKQKEKWAWNCLFIGLMVWYVIDTFISLQYNVVFNAIFNTMFLIPLLIPLIFTRKDFR